MKQILLICSVLVFSFSEIVAQDNVKPKEIERFSNLDFDEQKKELAQCFEKRINFAKNLSYRSEILGEKCENANGVVGKSVPGTQSKKVFMHWQRDNDFRCDIEFFEDRNLGAVQWSTSYWDSKEGVCRNFLKNKDLDRTFGRVDTVLNPAILRNDSFSFWLQGGSTETFPIPPYLFPHLLGCRDAWEIIAPFQESKVQLVAPYDAGKKYKTAITNTGKITLVLDPSKNYMPESGIIRGDVTLQNGGTPWREEKFEVQESLLCGDVWMPTLIKTSLRTSASRTGQFSVDTIRITEIDQGSVAKSDVTVKFPEGAEITDAVDGIAYDIDAQGNPVEATIQPLYGLDPSKVNLPPSKVASRARPVFIIAGLLLIGFALWKMYYDRKKRSGK